jgi:hypothetical protein
MGKFKIGDIIVGNDLSNDEYSYTTKEYDFLGKVVKIDEQYFEAEVINTTCPYLNIGHVVDGLEYGYFDLKDEENKTMNILEDQSGNGNNLVIALPTAQQAREMVENAMINKERKEFEYVSDLILTAINNNQTDVNGDGRLILATTEKLKELGYKVKTGSQYNQSFYSIHW